MTGSVYPITGIKNNNKSGIAFYKIEWEMMTIDAECRYQDREKFVR